MSDRPREERRSGSISVGQLVTFRVRDAYHPPAGDLLETLFGNRILRGRVTAISDGGEPGGGFVVLEIEGLSQAVIVPASDVTDRCDP